MGVRRVATTGDERFATSPDGIDVAYEVRGEGTPTLVLVHGWSCDRGYWDGQVEPLSRRFRVVTLDLAGHGESGLGRKSWTIASFGADVAAVVGELAHDSLVLIGHSMGGDVILEAARRLSGRVKGLIWVDTYRQLEDFHALEQVQERLAPFRAEFTGATRGFVRGMFPSDADASLVDRVVADMSAAPPEVAIGALESALNFGRHVPAMLQALKLPLIAINPADPPSDGGSLERHGVAVMCMRGVGHFLMMEKPQVFNDLLCEAIQGLDGRSDRTGGA